MALKGKGQAKSPNVHDNPQLGLESEIPVAPRSKRQARQAEEAQAKDPYLDSVKELDDVLLKFKNIQNQ